MQKVGFLSGVAFLLMAASPAPSPLTVTPTLEATIAPMGDAEAQRLTHGSEDFTAAPMPDADEAAPVLKTLGPPQPQFTPGLFQQRSLYRGEGYTPGSSVDANENRRARPAAGFNLKMPLD